MGRKIPAKKHRGVKDPVVQQARRLQSLKGKINAPPKDPDEQPVPRSLTRLFSFQNIKTESKNIKKKSKTRNTIHSTHVNSQNPISKMRRLPGESGRSFSLRINGAIRALNDENSELHYPEEDMECEDVKGSRMEEQRSRRERKRRRAQNDQTDATSDGHQRLTKTQRRALKIKEKKLKQAEAAATEPREVQYERVGFGEVVHAPPVLCPLRKASRKGGAPRPGQRGLLLTPLLTGGTAGATTSTGSLATVVTDADAMRRERARLEAVEAYRALKAERLRRHAKR
ncbi:hypothetical protein ACJJTC_000306 [Scirpophaga incertulas]